MKVVDLAVDRPVATIMLLVSLLVLGVVAIFRIPLGFMPAFDEPEIDVEIDFPGSHPLEALEEVGRPLEGAIATVPGITSMRTMVRPGRVHVSASFSWSDDMDVKQLEVREAVERIRPELPALVRSVTIATDTGGPGGGILEGRVSAERDLSESWALLDSRIRRPLERVPGVSSVELGGVAEQQVEVELDLEALRSHGLDPGDVLGGLDRYNVDADAGVVRGSGLRFGVRSLGRFRDVDEVRSMPLGQGSLKLSDVATVEVVEPRLPFGRHLDRKFAISLTVQKEPTANTVATVDALKERIAEIEQDPRLQGITLLVWEDAGDEIRRSILGLRDAGVFGGVLAVFVLLFFLRKLRTTAVVAVAIPFSLVVTCGAMFVLGAEFNVLTMLGLMFGVGMLVDNAVVVIENIHRKQGMGLPARQAARIGTREVFLAVLASTATTIIVWSWLFVFERNEMTIMMGSVAMTICLAVACSLLVSVTFIPLAASRFLRTEEVTPGFVLRRLVPAYRRLLGFSLRHRVLGLVVLGGLGASFVFPFQKLEKHDEPRFQERMVQLRYEVTDSPSKEVLEGYVDRVEEWIESRKDELGYENIYSWFSEDWGTMTRLYLPREEATEERLDAVKEALREDLPEIPGVKFNLGEEEWWRRRDNSGGRQLQVAVHGEDPDFVRDLALRVEERLVLLPDIVEVKGPGVGGRAEAIVEVDPERARSLGVDPSRVGQSVSLAFRGTNLRRFQTEESELEMVVKLPEDHELGLQQLSLLPVRRDDGTSVPLSSVATVRPSRTPPMIWRNDRVMTERVGVEYPKDITTDEGRERIAAAMKDFKFPVGYGWSFGQWGWEREQGLDTMRNGVLLSLLVVILLMMALFESFTQPLAIIITLPLAFTGAFWALWLLDYDLDVVAFMGLVILVGIVVNNGIVMVDHVNQLRRAGAERVDALIEGCGDRLRPILMTAITTIFGLIPLALADSTVAGAYIDGCAVAVIGGLTTSTIFTLLGLPIWYSLVEDVGALATDLIPRRRADRPAPAPDETARGAKGVLAGGGA